MSIHTATTVSLVLLAATVAYTQAPLPPNTNTTIRGCVAPAQRDGSLAAKAGATATPDKAIDEANNPEPTGVFVLLDAVPDTAAHATTKDTSSADVGGQPRRTSYSLSGHESELTKLNGSRVEITGTVVATIGKGLPERTDVMADGIQRIRVASVKKITGSCSPARK